MYILYLGFNYLLFFFFFRFSFNLFARHQHGIFIEVNVLKTEQVLKNSFSLMFSICENLSVARSRCVRAMFFFLILFFLPSFSKSYGCYSETENKLIRGESADN